mmetsp:Transcript_5585/g.12989  ORF Transcript_5585/g.12989 Transcript_5585/m.12989 type:complete len:1056 (-) Transcript_5585:318-3485(-)
MDFKLKSKDLSNLVRLTFDNTTASDVETYVLQEYDKKLGGLDGILRSLKIEKEKGVNSNDVKDRANFFGKNEVEQEPQEPLWKLMWEALQDPTLIFLTCAAILSLLIGVFVEQKPYGWLEGVAILFAVVVVVTVGAVNDYQKEKQFRDLNAKKDDIDITVIRDGQQTTISTKTLVVGDIVLLSTGDILPADGIVLGRNDLAINEKMLTGETVMKKKSSSYIIEHGSVKSSPTLFAGTFVQEGEGRMLVVAVGANTYQGTMEEKMKEAEGGRSILQKKLDAMTDLITTVSMWVSIALVVILCLRMFYAFYADKCCFEKWDHKVHWSELLGFIITGITIFVVAVPEGLPLAVTIALAFSVKKMLKDQNLVRHLSACETMGGATTICSDKTGTLTTSRMTVVKAWCGNRVFSNMRDIGAQLPQIKEKFATAAVVNTLFKTYLKKNTNGTWAYCGNDTECSLLIMANEIGHNYESIRQKYPDEQEGRLCNTFSSDRKRMSTIVPQNGKEVLYCKGAAEIVSALCPKIMTADGSIKDIDVAMRNQIEQTISDFADEGLRTLCIAQRELSKPSSEMTLEQLESDLTLVGIVGIEDPLRDEVPGAIKDCQTAGIVVRMVTGDNIQTARAIAKKCGIITSEDGEGAVLDGKTFRDRVCDSDGNIIQSEFDKVWPPLRVLARSTPLDKHVLVSGIQASSVGIKQTVAVTGDGTNDAPALKKADVGFAMGIQGTDVAKNASDVIIMDDNFVSIVAAVKWGRCVYDNICKFLQFQLTVNITACSLACVGAAILTESPLNAIQMLWVNLIMDSFASLALATEDPTDELLRRKPYPRDQAVLSQTMVRNMILHASWQLIVLSFLIFGMGDVCRGTGSVCEGEILVDYFGNIRSGRPAAYDWNGVPGACIPMYNSSDPSTFDAKTGKPLRPHDFCAGAHHGVSDNTQHYTMVFNVFVLMQIFNEINSRKIHNELNVFDGVFRNSFFLVIVIGTLITQFALIEVPGLNSAFGCTHLTRDQWIACLLLGASVIPLNVLFHMVPVSWFPAGGGGMPDDDDEETEGKQKSKDE